MKSLIVAIAVIIMSQSFVLSQHRDIFLVAGMPDIDFRPESPDEIYKASLLRIDEDSIVEVMTLSDSMQVLRLIRSYSDHNKIVLFSGQKAYLTQPFANTSYDLTILDTKSLDTTKVSVPKELTYLDLVYKLNTNRLYGIANEGIDMAVEYFNRTVKDASHPRELFCIVNKDGVEISNPSHYNKLFTNGSTASPLFFEGSDFLMLQGDTLNRKLVIPSYLDKDSIFHLDIVAGIKVNPYYTANVLINNERLLLIFYYYQKDSQFYHLYNKSQKAWLKFPSYEAYLVNFGDWIAGIPKIEVMDTPYLGGQVGDGEWIDSDTQFGYSIKKYIERKLNRTKLSGWLSLRSTSDPNVLIEWNTKQGDSEILLVEDQVVYYRKHDELWKAPILNSNTLGEPLLIIKNQLITSSHYMFLN